MRGQYFHNPYFVVPAAALPATASLRLSLVRRQKRSILNTLIKCFFIRGFQEPALLAWACIIPNHEAITRGNSNDPLARGKELFFFGAILIINDAGPEARLDCSIQVNVLLLRPEAILKARR